MSKRFLVSAVLAATVSSSAFAGSSAPGTGGDFFRLWFDESGNGKYSVDGGPITPDRGFVWNDPTNPSLNGFWTYALPQGPVGTGDVFVNGGDEGSGFSDGLRFFNVGNNAYMQFYSSGSDSFVDSFGVPSDFNYLTSNITTESSDARESFCWLCAPGNNQYFGISGVPEPSTWAMMAIGFAGLAFAGYRRVRVVTRAV
jgi:PEP-CTERM motif